MSEFYLVSDVVPNLWSEYEKTPEFQTSPEPLVGIKQDHPIIIRREEEGLSRIIDTLENDLSDSKILYLKKLRERAPSEWIGEWIKYHRILFDRVLKICGAYRSIDVWFDTIEASEKEYKIPNNRLVPSRMSELADRICHLLSQGQESPEEILTIMAIVHFEFIRIHPFVDGNGRIGRIIIDQLCLAFSLPTVMGGYPRANVKQRRAYHEAIKDCCFDPDCKKLTQWIKYKIEERTLGLA